MGQDMYHYAREVAIQSHGGLMRVLLKVREQLLADPIGGWEELIAEIDKEINNGTIR